MILKFAISLTVFCVSADNLAAHGIGGFVESFRTGHVCRFCMGSIEQFQVTEVRESFLSEPKLAMTYMCKLCKKVTRWAATLVLKVAVRCENPWITSIQSQGFLLIYCTIFWKVSFPWSFLFVLKRWSGGSTSLWSIWTTRLHHSHISTLIKWKELRHLPKCCFLEERLEVMHMKMPLCSRLLPFLFGSVVPEGDKAWAVLM